MPDDIAREVLFVLATDEGQAAIARAADARIRAVFSGTVTAIDQLRAPREPAQDEPTPADVCPRCGSPKPELHPAMQADGGEIQPCPHAFHAAARKVAGLQYGPFTPPATPPDPLLPGLRAAEGAIKRMRNETFARDPAHQYALDCALNVIAEIARRGGA